jgi:diguanylate cyclase (GGDEF)-like protein
VAAGRLLHAPVPREVLGCLLAAIVSCVWMLTQLGGAAATELFSNVAEVVAPLYAGISCFRTARKLTARGRRGWLLLAIAMISWCAGQIVWMEYEYSGSGSVPVPSAADIGFLALVPLAAAGGAVLITTGRGTQRVLLDGLIICGSLLCASWVAGLGTLWRAGASNEIELLVTLAYPIGDVVVAAMMFTLIGHVGKAQRLSVGLLGIGAIALAVADSAFIYLVADDDYSTASLLDCGWIAGFLLIGLAAWTARSRPQTPPDVPTPMWLALPYIPLGIALLTAVGESLHGGRVDPVLYGGGGVLVVLVMSRQLLSVRDNLRLTERLTSAVTELRGREDQLRELAFTDAVTGLPNRAQLAAEAQRALLDPTAEVGLFVIDLDRFNDINDALGHDAGDEVLRRAGAALVRSVNSGAVVARLGGDKFAVLVDSRDLPDLAGRTLSDRFTALGHQLLRALHGPVMIAGVPVTIEASVGVVHTPHHTHDLGVLLRRADAAMDIAKRVHVGVEVWHPNLEMRTGDDLLILAELRAAIEHGQLRLHYQTLIDARTGEVRGTEALVRWQHPDRGLLMPGSFIVAAERSGLIVSLTDWVLVEAVAQVGRWRRAGRTLPVSVNVSAACVAREGLPARIAELLAAHDVPAGLLTIEVTETAVMADPDRAAARLKALREIGVRVSIDDFGTGNTSLALLTRLPIDELKLDRTFVSRVNDSPPHAAIVRTVADLASRLGLTVVAEGVEDEPIASSMRRLHFDVLQGFLFGRPQPPDQLPSGLSATPDRPLSPATVR